MRIIEVDTDVYARIWSHRGPGEETENEILQRLLGGTPENKAQRRTQPMSSVSRGGFRKRLWRDDVRDALEQLGGTAPLSDIYEKVRSIRRHSGRSLPRTTDDIIRRELENNSSDSHAFTKKRDWFTLAEGKGAGIWSLRSSGGA